MKFSLIVSTRGRVAELQRLLKSLSAQACQDFEVIVSDQNDDDRLDEVFQNPAWNGRLIRLRNHGGVSRGRNAGLGIASGEILGFPDDDCVYQTDVLGRVSREFDRQPAYGFLSGRSYDDEGDDSVSRAAKCGSRVKAETIHLQGIEFALFIRRKELGDLRFDENMGVGARTPWQSDEGPDLVFRLMKQGVAGYYDPTLKIWHARSIRKYDAAEIDRTYRYACGNGYFYKKHGYGRMYFGYRLLRGCGGLALAWLRMNGGKARLYRAKLRGQWRGWTSYGRGKDVPEPGVESSRMNEAAATTSHQ